MEHTWNDFQKSRTADAFPVFTSLLILVPTIQYFLDLTIYCFLDLTTACLMCQTPGQKIWDIVYKITTSPVPDTGSDIWDIVYKIMWNLKALCCRSNFKNQNTLNQNTLFAFEIETRYFIHQWQCSSEYINTCFFLSYYINIKFNLSQLHKYIYLVYRMFGDRTGNYLTCIFGTDFRPILKTPPHMCAPAFMMPIFSPHTL